MYVLSVSYENKILELYYFDNLKMAKEKYKTRLVEYLLGYGVIWDDISESEHRKNLLNKSLNELREIEFEAKFNKELDYDIKLERKKLKRKKAYVF